MNNPTPVPIPATTGLASEGSTHWYSKDGAAAYDVPNKSTGIKCTVCTGNMRSKAAKAVTLECQACDETGYMYPDMRPATLRDAKVLDLCHSITGITKVLANYNIVTYQLRQLAEACYTAPKDISSLPFEEWHAKVSEDAAEHARQARTKGTDIHATIERGIRGESLEGYIYAPWFEAMKTEFRRELGFWPEFEAEKSFTNRRLGYGGKLDGFARKSPIGPIVLDSKTKDIPKLEKIKPYESEIMQLAAGREAANAPRARCFNAFFDREEPVCFLLEAPEDELVRGFAMFRHCLAIKQLQDRWCPSWVTG